MSDERELIADRERKVNELRQAGQNPYANGFSPAHTARDVHAWFAAGNVPTANPLTDEPKAVRFSVAGRIVALRSFGKAAFAKVRDRSGEIQVWVKQDVLGEKSFSLWRAMERGDFIGAVGPAVLTKTGELLDERSLAALAGANQHDHGSIRQRRGDRLGGKPFNQLVIKPVHLGLYYRLNRI